MPRRAARVLLLPLVLAIALTGCSSGGKKSSTGSATDSKGGGLPAVAGSYGSKPTFTFPGSNPPATLQSAVLRKGSGQPVASGDLLVADYLGQIWKGAVFDNSYDRKAPAGFVIGTGKVIPGWDQVLVGIPVGSRVLMSIPPDKGYGTAGNAQAGIKGTDTLEFVVDIVAAYGKSAVGQRTAVPQKVATPGVTVGGAPGVVPTVTVTKSAKAPKAPKLTLLDKGNGPPVGPGLLVVQYVATRYTGQTAGSTYADGAPTGVNVGGGSGGGTPFDLTRGLPLGSRVLLQIPGPRGQAPLAVVIDLIAQPKTAALSG